MIFLSTPSARRATRRDGAAGARPNISIHALREEGDQHRNEFLPRHADFYPRPPRGGRPEAAAAKAEEEKFLSTPSARRATKGNGHGLLPKRFLSTPSARRATVVQVCKLGDIEFLSTPSARRATRAAGRHRPAVPISIHALREEGDAWKDGRIQIHVYFYPRPPRGGRH